MHNKKIKILKFHIIKKNLVKNMYKKLILKSIIQSKNVTPIQRAFCDLKLKFLQKNKFNNISNLKNICFLTNKVKSTNKKLHYSRYIAKQFSILKKLQNFKQAIKD